MARKNVHQLAYTAIRIEGGLIPAEELTRLTTLQAPDKTQQTEALYQIPKGLKLRDEIARNFKIAQNLWQDFQAQRQRIGADVHSATVRDFLLPLLRQAMGYTDLAPAAPIQASNSVHHSYQIGHAALGGRLPVVLAGADQPLDQPAERFGDTNPDTARTRRRSPYMLAQEALNATDRSLWAIVSNGLTLRILRDNPSLTRPAYVEVDLEALFTEELYADFTAFWLLAHASRFGLADAEPADCPWERWRNAGQAVGVTARLNLRYQVADALRSLGTGFLQHPANTSLRAALQDAEQGSATKQRFFEELLSLVYRFIFLATVEDRSDATTGRSLIFTPDATDAAQARYWAGYSLTWLRERSVRRSSHDAHSDLWQALSITFDGLAGGQPALGLPALGGLFAAEQCPLLNAYELDNRHLLTAVFQLGFFRQPSGLTRVNYRDMGAEELGSVYESLLELVPDVQHITQPQAARFAFVGDDDDASNKGNARKLTGSYYTPDSLVQELIKSALEPVLTQTIETNSADPVQALLQLTVCDPACGSGHFLLGAARRMADEVAKLRAQANGGAPTPADYRHALRDVVGHCIYGVDKNPMAIALAKTALWLEAYTPDLPLTFIDHHLQVGDALLGVLDPKILENGIPDEAYAVLSGDDKTTAAALKKQNKAERKSWKQVVANDLFAATTLVHDAHTVERLADDTLDGIATKRSAWAQASQLAGQSTLAKLADTYVAAFLAPKVPEGQAYIPLSGYLWGLLHPNATHANQQSTAELAAKLCRTHSVFHWWLAFPQVATKGGFSVMLGNPPWEQLQLNEEEFFAARAPSVAALAGSKRKHAIAALESSAPWLWESFCGAKRQMEAANQFFRGGGRFKLSARGKLDTYPLFSETFLQATARSGRAGFIVKAGIATDDSNKFYFSHLVDTSRLVSLIGFDNAERIFPAVHPDTPFVLVTLGTATEPSRLLNYALRIEHLSDPRRAFRLTADEFALINPNTRTCPVFRSEHDAELAKKLYRAAPVLIAEAVTDDDGKVTSPEVNPWGISFSQGLFNMTSDSGLFADVPVAPGAPKRLPLYEAKMIHQFDHRWASFIPTPELPNDDWPSRDCTLAEHGDDSYIPSARHWVDEREVLARIARVPARVARAWLLLHAARDAADSLGHDAALAKGLLALAQWVAGELFHRAASAAHSAEGWSPTQAQPHVAATEQQLKARFPCLNDVLLGEGLTTSKALAEFPKWAAQNHDARLDNDELATLDEALRASALADALRVLLDLWLDRRSPRWLMGWRDITNATNERTVIASVVPRVGVGNNLPLMLFRSDVAGAPLAALLGNLCSMAFDFVARHKVGGTHLNYFIYKQLPVLPPDRYTDNDLVFIVSRVLELTHTAHDMQAWANDLLAAMPSADPRPSDKHGTPLAPFPWDPERRALLRAELDAYYARLYGLTRDELRYILDPADVMGADYPSETFRVLKNNEMREFGEYRTQRLVLDAWDKLSKGLEESTSDEEDVPPPIYSEQGVIKTADEAEFAGLVLTLVRASSHGLNVDQLQDAVVNIALAGRYLNADGAQRLKELCGSLPLLGQTSTLDLVQPFVQRLESARLLQRKRDGAFVVFFAVDGEVPADVRVRPSHAELASLMLKLAANRSSTAAQKDEDGGEKSQARFGG